MREFDVLKVFLICNLKNIFLMEHTVYIFIYCFVIVTLSSPKKGKVFLRTKILLNAQH